MSLLSQFYPSGSSPDVTSESLSVEFFLVGGGGGGGTVNAIGPNPLNAGASGGGGGGAVMFGTNNFRFGVTYPIIVGAGGAVGSNGGYTKFGSYTAPGGGAGGEANGASVYTQSSQTTGSGPSGGAGAPNLSVPAFSRLPAGVANYNSKINVYSGGYTANQWNTLSPHVGMIDLGDNVYLMNGNGHGSFSYGPGGGGVNYGGGGGGIDAYMFVGPPLGTFSRAEGRPGFNQPQAFTGIGGNRSYWKDPSAPSGFAGGGGAGTYNLPGAGPGAPGADGGGTGGSIVNSTGGLGANATAGTVNTGGGGGGGARGGVPSFTLATSAAGGSGFVVIRYPTAYSAATVTGNTANPGVYINAAPASQREYYWTGPGTITFN